jgi:CheY-like chemotaxis protein
LLLETIGYTRIASAAGNELLSSTSKFSSFADMMMPDMNGDDTQTIKSNPDTEISQS